MLLYPLVLAFGPSAGGGLRVTFDASRASPLMSEGARRKVVITGMGALTSLGQDPDTIFENLLDGKCGIGRLTRFNPEDYPSVPQIASEVSDFDVTKYWSRPEGRPDGVGFDPDKYDRYTHFAIAASLQCLRDADLDPSSIESPYRFGCNVASGAGGIGKLEANCEALFTSGESAVSGPDALGVSNTASQMVAMEVGARGPNGNYVSACASGTHALGEAFRSIAYDEADVMLAGGTEACITPLTIAGFNSMRAMCTTANDSPQTASRPFDADRCGFVMGEGAGVLLLESEEHVNMMRSEDRTGCASSTCHRHTACMPLPCDHPTRARRSRLPPGPRTRREDLLRASRLCCELRRLPHHRSASRGRGHVRMPSWRPALR